MLSLTYDHTENRKNHFYPFLSKFALYLEFQSCLIATVRDGRVKGALYQTVFLDNWEKPLWWYRAIKIMSDSQLDVSLFLVRYVNRTLERSMNSQSCTTTPELVNSSVSVSGSLTHNLLIASFYVACLEVGSRYLELRNILTLEHLKLPKKIFC